ncbi:MAG: VOC family protein [Rhodospirillaceae bacterium]
MFDQQVTFIYTEDLGRSAAFYGETLALPLALDQGGCRIYRAAPGAFIGVCRCGPDRPVGGDGVILTLVTPHVDGWYRRLRDKGVAFDSKPAENPDFDIYHCFLRDPDGYRIEIQQFRDPAWAAATR